MKGRLLFPICGLLSAIVSCHNNDPAPIVCKPTALKFDTDSVVYAYNDDRRITTVSYYTSGLKTKQDELAYNSQGQLATVAKLFLMIDGSTSVDAYHAITYGSNGLPSNLSTDSYSGHFATEFTHDDLGRLTHAETRWGTQGAFVGLTRYEYDANNNVPKVFYTLNLNQKIQEVLARENLSFDDKEKFYVNSPELKVCNEYVYGYLPTKNNCLGSKVYYYSYSQHFASPLSVTFSASYDEQGQITSLESSGSNQLYSGEVLFKNVIYNCR